LLVDERHKLIGPTDVTCLIAALLNTMTVFRERVVHVYNV